MYLTNEEERMYNGEFGPGIQKAMQILVALGDIYDAVRLIEVDGVHIPSGAATVAMDSGIEFVESLAETGVKSKVFTTLNTASIDFARWKEIGIPEKVVEKQIKHTRAYEKIGVMSCHSCTPYLTGNVPMKNSNIAWGESSAIPFANSVLGARTNRESGPSALAASIIGKTPLFGLHLDENRMGNYLIEVETTPKDISDFGALGYYVGAVVGTGVPVFTGLRAPTIDEHKSLGAAISSPSTVSLYHILNVTPEAKTLKEVFNDEKIERISVGKEELEKTFTELTRATNPNVDVVCIGCPFCSIEEIRDVAFSLKNKTISDDVRMLLCTSLQTKVLADRIGYTETIEKAGAMVLSDVCPVLFPKELLKKWNCKTIATNSAKLAHYAPLLCYMEPFIGNLDKVIDASIQGTWEG